MLKRIVLLLLCLMLTCSAQAAVDVKMTVSGSEILSDGALRALSAWLQDAHLVLQGTDDGQLITLYQAEEKLLEAVSDGETSTLTSGAWTAEIENRREIPQAIPQMALSWAQALGELLKDYEKSANATAELGNVVKAQTQLSYALSKEEWAAVWPQVCKIIGTQLESVTIESKGTFRRYFAADGSEIGAYFYAEKVRIAEDDVREVRLEYGCQADKGLYLAFRCPNKNETRNLRISLTMKRTERTDRISYSVSCDVRRRHDENQDTVLAEASLKEQEGVFSGKATINYTKKRADGTQKYALTIKPDGRAVSFEISVNKLKALAGEITFDAADDRTIILQKANAAMEKVQKETALQMLFRLQEINEDDRMELIYYLNRSAYLTGDEADVYIAYDPEFTVSEEP